MKKISLLIGATAMAAASFAATPVNVFFSTKGPDLYGDGTVVQDGEVYALVWIADGAEFEGINSDGTPVNPAVNKIVGEEAVAKGGRCPLTAFPLDNGDQDLVGTLAVYLFDTRVTAQSGVSEVAKKNGDGTYVSLNSCQKIDADITKTECNFLPESAALTGEGAVASVVDEATIPQPVIKSYDAAKGDIVVGSTVVNIRYAVSAGTTPTASDVVLANGVSGRSDGGDITLTVNEPTKYNFFKVVRSK